MKLLTQQELERIEMNVMSVGCTDTNARRLLDHSKAALDEIERLKTRVTFAQAPRWRQAWWTLREMVGR